ncbi:metal-binding protein [Phyllobacterium phragmitis]|uniref:Metal-binding protein n=1 Tax=Phyllobacterium phragmitis TaxID=2670329 RepID=A0A2S9IYK4_9HYPH|nr:DUF411 domain-containing protein [Phyllobacterium phragmitis]PRD45611.1 metal-binding protein [Phyllobacterium phragmitis]
MSNFAKTLVLASLLSSIVPAMAGEKDVTLYKDPQCGCCASYADYLKENGFNVTTKPTGDVPAMSLKAGIPEGSEGCHLSFIDGYVVSGHVPVGVVNKLLTERPDIKGVTLPGMPMGSPGMGGTKKAPFEILEISKSGDIGGVYARE